MRSISARVMYLRYILRPGFWRWLVKSLDYVIVDHVHPWTVNPRQPSSMVHPSVSFRSAENVRIGKHTRVQNGCVLWASPKSKIEIGDHSGLGPGTMIFSSNHEFKPGRPYHEQGWSEEDVIIGEDVWVGAGSVILAGVSIGSGSIVAAGSVVTRDIPAASVAAGVPARVLRPRGE